MGVDAEDAGRRLLAAGAGERRVDEAVAVDGGVGDGVEIVADGDADFTGPFGAGEGAAFDLDDVVDRFFGDAGDDVGVRADDERGLHVAEEHAGVRAVGEAFAVDADLTAGDGGLRREGLDAGDFAGGFTCHVLISA